jgi:hypothetical protein
VKDAGSASVGTFLTGVLLMAIAALTPMVTFSFIHWAGDQGHAAAQAMQRGTEGVAAGRDHIQRAREWRAEHFGSRDNAEAGVADEVPDESGSDRSSQRAGQETVGSMEATREAHASDDGSESGSDRHGGSDGDGGSVAVATASATVDGGSMTQSGSEAESIASPAREPDGAQHDDRQDQWDDQT